MVLRQDQSEGQWEQKPARYSSRRRVLKWLFSLGILTCCIGLGLNFFSGITGTMRLAKGIAEDRLSLGLDTQTEEVRYAKTGFRASLDTVYLQSYSPKFHILVREAKNRKGEENIPGIPPQTTLVKRYGLEPMKIHRAGTSPYYFRLVDFYPDFGFAYQYPARKDTIPPRAPGITLELTTKESKEIVTLRSDQPERNHLKDILGLGTTFEYGWSVSEDSLFSSETTSMPEENMVLFSGEKNMIYQRFQGEWKILHLMEDSLYLIPGTDSLGFTVLTSFPDIAHLRAVPVSKSDTPLNPVARLEIWKKGEKANEAYIYPETMGSQSGQFNLPGSAYQLALEEDEKTALKACRCKIILEEENSDQEHILSLGGKRSAYQRQYSFKLKKCFQSPVLAADLEVAFVPGRYVLLTGAIITILAGIGLFAGRNHRFPG